MFIRVLVDGFIEYRFDSPATPQVYAIVGDIVIGNLRPTERDANKNTTILFLSQFQPLRDCYEHLLNMEIILRWSDLLINLRN